jgi:cytochrome c peroxidase
MNKNTLVLLAALCLPAAAQDKILDLTKPANYANQTIPAYITKDNTPVGNDITDLGATLGRVLFYDKRLSRNNTISCSSCHDQANGFGDTATASTGVAGTTGRHSMRLINPRFATETKFFWDERAATAEAQATQPIQDHIEMGFSGTLGDPSFPDLVTKLSAIEEYQVLFQGVFGDTTITEERVGKAIAQFVRSIQSFDSKYDAGRAIRNDAQPFPNFTTSENTGKQLFLTPPNQGGAGCAGCHRPPEFDIDPNSGNNGLVSKIGGGTDFTNTRSPSLRDLVDANGTPHGGFMHDGSLSTLLSVINHYNSIPAVVTGIDPRLTRPGGQPQRLNLTTQQKNDLIAFLRTLTGTSIYTDEKFSSPFNEDDTLAIVVLPTDATEMTFSKQDNSQMVTLRAACVPNVEYLFQTSPDLDKWTSTPITAPANGQLEMTIPIIETDTKMFYRFAYGTPTE